MINLSEIIRQQPETSFLRKLRSLRDPDIYLAENIRDYRENAPNLEFPWYKRSVPFVKDLDERVYISIMDVRLNKLKINNFEIPNYFVIHDETYAEVVYWNINSNLIPTLHSFEELQEKQGLKDGDYIYDILLRYLIKKDFPSIVEVRKYNFSNRKPEKESIMERVRSFFPSPEVIPESI